MSINKNIAYEKEKRALIDLDLTPEQYQKKIQEIIQRLGV